MTSTVLGLLGSAPDVLLERSSESGVRICQPLDSFKTQPLDRPLNEEVMQPEAVAVLQQPGRRVGLSNTLDELL